MGHGRRSAPLLPALLAACPAAVRRRTAMRGFKEDLEAWRSSLTAEEQELVQKQATGEFNKNFRKSDACKKVLLEEKVKSFSKILGKFSDAESEDYMKEAEAKVPNYYRLLEKAGDKELDFALTNRIAEIDRDADRRYLFATRNIEKAAKKGELYPQSSPMMEPWEFRRQRRVP